MSGKASKGDETFIVVVEVDRSTGGKGRVDKNRVVVTLHADLAKRYGVNKGQYQVHPLVETNK
jgi:hypothetical protein